MGHIHIHKNKTEQVKERKGRRDFDLENSKMNVVLHAKVNSTVISVRRERGTHINGQKGGPWGERRAMQVLLSGKSTRRQKSVIARAEEPTVDTNLEELEENEVTEADKLRAQERFMVIDQGTAECSGCGYEYDRRKGDPEYPIPAGMAFSELPADWTCPICGAEKTSFQNRTKTVAGFAANQKYGLGTNSMTGDEKLTVIYGTLIFFFSLFLLGYAFN